jgi:hypothetical protein
LPLSVVCLTQGCLPAFVIAATIVISRERERERDSHLKQNRFCRLFRTAEITPLTHMSYGVVVESMRLHSGADDWEITQEKYQNRKKSKT